MYTQSYSHVGILFILLVHTFPMDESLTSVSTWKASSGSAPGTNETRCFITNKLRVQAFTSPVLVFVDII